MKYDLYVDGVKVGSYNNHYDVDLAKALWKQIFNKEVVVISK